MTRTKVVPGAELEIPSAEDIAAAIRPLLAEPELRTMRGAKSGATDSAGALSDLIVYTVPPGWDFSLNRLLIEADGYTPAAPWVNAAGYIQLVRSGEVVDFVTLGGAVAGGIPMLLADSDDTAHLFRNGQTVGLRIVGGPTSTVITAKFQGREKRTVS